MGWFPLGILRVNTSEGFSYMFLEIIYFHLYDNILRFYSLNSLEAAS